MRQLLTQPWQPHRTSLVARGGGLQLAWEKSWFHAMRLHFLSETPDDGTLTRADGTLTRAIHLIGSLHPDKILAVDKA